MILLVQIIFIIFLIAGASLYFQYVDWTLRMISIIVAVKVLNRQEKAAYKLIWLFLLMLLPIFGGIMYLFFYFQSNPRKLRGIIKQITEASRDCFYLPGNRLSELVDAEPEFEAQVYYLQNYSGFPVYSRTEQEYFPSGEAFYQRAISEMEKAERYIFMEFFILQEGMMLDPIISILERKARQGLDIRLIYDDMGCFMSLPSDYPKYLKEKGIKCLVFNPFKPILSSLQNNRDHRKILSIDGKVAFTGSLNIADEYINAVERFGHWKDAAIMLKGEGAWSLTLIFLQMWDLVQNFRKNKNSRKGPDEVLLQKEYKNYISMYPWKTAPCTIPSDGFVQPYADSPVDDENVGKHVYIQIINKAKKYVYINTPYLVIDDNLISALTLAAKSGVDIRIITPHRWDKWFVAIASRSYYRQLILAGVKVYEYTAGFNHSKTFVSDDRIAAVGTTNLDFRSLYLHFECGVLVYKSNTVMAVKEDFLNTIPVSHEITPEECAPGIFKRIIPDVLRIFAPLM